MALSSTLRVAFVGAGYMASEHLRAFAACTNVQLVGIYSRSIDRAEGLARIYPNLTIFTSIEDLYTHTAADLVVIAVSELACKTVCEQAFNYPWTLLIEKPVGYNFSEARKIEIQSVEKGARAYVALNRRFYSSTLQLKAALEESSGIRVVSILDQEEPAKALAAGRPMKVIQNWMYANSIHLIDYFSQLCRGKHQSTQVLSPWYPEAPGPVIAQLRFSAGDVGLYQACWNAPGPWSIAVSTEQLRAELRPIEQLSLQKAGSRKAELQVGDPIDREYKPGLWRQAQEAIKAAYGEPTALPSLKEANRSMALVASIYGTQ